MSDDLERTLTEALDRHARRLGPRPDGHLDGVWSHLDRRRNRRRGVAAVGSVVAVGAGVAGLALIGPAEPTAPSAGDGAPVTTLNGVAWRCAGLFGDDGVYRYYVECTPVAELPPLTTGWSPFTAPPTWPATTITLPIEVAASTVPLTTSVATLVTSPPNTAVDLIRYEVVPGDSLSSIATAFGIDPLNIAITNGWDDGLDHPLFPGDVIDIAYVPAATAPPTTTPLLSSLDASRVCEDTSGDAPVTVPCDLAPTTTIELPAVSVGSTTPPAPPPAVTTYRCTGVLGTEGGFEYLAACDTIGPDGAVEPVPIAAAPTAPPPTTAFALPGTIPLLTAPPTTPALPTVVEDTVPPTAPILAVSEIEQIYTVMAGDSISLIAGRFGVPMTDIVNYNAWEDGLDHPLLPGDVVLIPPGALVAP